LQARKDKPVILFTGVNETASPEMAKAAGISYFITKPIAKREVTETNKAGAT
jgi:AmiR/NasT family two-component response regulator